MSIDFNHMYKDLWEENFSENQHDEFLQLLEHFRTTDRWETYPAAQVTFAPLSSVAASDLMIGGKEQYGDSMDNGFPIAVSLPDGLSTIRPYLYKAVKQHHRDTAPVLSDMLKVGAYKDLCDHLNSGRTYLKKDILALFRGGKISGWFSEFNASWDELSQFTFVEKAMAEEFPDFQFVRAEVSHYFTIGNYQLGESIESSAFTTKVGCVIEPYIKVWEDAGGDGDALRRAIPICSFMTGESGLSSIVLSPALLFPGGNKVSLGASLAVNHRGEDKAVWGKFESFPEQIAVLFRKGMNGIERLCTRPIAYPYNCMTHAAKLFYPTLRMQCIRTNLEAAELFLNDQARDTPVYALEIFNLLTDMVNGASKDLGPMKQVQSTEILARLLWANWDEFDKAQPANFSGKMGASGRDIDWLSL